MTHSYNQQSSPEGIAVRDSIFVASALEMRDGPTDASFDAIRCLTESVRLCDLLCCPYSSEGAEVEAAAIACIEPSSRLTTRTSEVTSYTRPVALVS